MTISAIVMIAAGFTWLAVDVVNPETKGSAWLKDAARLTFFAAVFVVLLSVSGKIAF